MVVVAALVDAIAVVVGVHVSDLVAVGFMVVVTVVVALAVT